MSWLELHVPRTPRPLDIDGQLEEVAWQASARSGPFTERGGEQQARPYSDVRLLFDDEALYVALYAADEDIHATAAHDGPLWLEDAFRLDLEMADGGVKYTLEFGANGSVTDSVTKPPAAADYGWESHARVKVSVDETLNDPRDLDEEWVVEVAVPWSSLGLHGPPAELTVSARRCDTPQNEKRRCATWGSAGERQARVKLRFGV